MVTLEQVRQAMREESPEEMEATKREMIESMRQTLERIHKSLTFPAFDFWNSLHEQAKESTRVFNERNKGDIERLTTGLAKVADVQFDTAQRLQTELQKVAEAQAQTAKKFQDEMDKAVKAQVASFVKIQSSFDTSANDLSKQIQTTLQHQTLTVEQAASVMKVSTETVRRRIRAGTLEASGGGHRRSWLIPASEVAKSVAIAQREAIQGTVSDGHEQHQTTDLEAILALALTLREDAERLTRTAELLEASVRQLRNQHEIHQSAG